jgi:hypothetical protein
MIKKFFLKLNSCTLKKCFQALVYFKNFFWRFLYQSLQRVKQPLFTSREKSWSFLSDLKKFFIKIRFIEVVIAHHVLVITVFQDNPSMNLLLTLFCFIKKSKITHWLREIVRLVNAVGLFVRGEVALRRKVMKFAWSRGRWRVQRVDSSKNSNHSGKIFFMNFSKL